VDVTQVAVAQYKIISSSVAVQIEDSVCRMFSRSCDGPGGTSCKVDTGPGKTLTQRGSSSIGPIDGYTRNPAK